MSMLRSKQVVVSDVTISREHILRMARKVKLARGIGPSEKENIAESMCLAWVDYLEDILTGSIPIPHEVISRLNKHEAYFERFGI